MVNWIEIGQMDELARMDTPAHRLDARAKVLVTFAFILIVMSFPRYALSALTPFLLYPVALISLGRIPPGSIAKKLLLAAPFALAVGILNPVMDRQTVTAVGNFAVTGGVLSFASIMLRFVLCAGAALALVACTGMHRLGTGLEQLGVPRVFIVQLLFLYRYLFVISDEATRMVRGVQLRSNTTRALRLRVYASLVGNLLLRSMDRADRIHRAMAARGFDGKIRVLRRSTPGWTDAAFTCGCLALFAAARTWNLADELGLLLTGVLR